MKRDKRGGAHEFFPFFMAMDGLYTAGAESAGAASCAERYSHFCVLDLDSIEIVLLNIGFSFKNA